MFNSNVGTLPVSIPIGVNGGSGFGNGNGFDDIIALAIIAMIFGWNNGGIFGGSGSGSVRDAYVLNSDFATIQRQLSDGFGSTESKLDNVNNGICSLGYDQLGQMNGINTNILQSTNALSTQLADCCCKTQSGIERINTNNAINTATITNAIKDCCCDNEKIAMQAEYNAQARNCNTLQAIDKVGDRIIDYLNADKTQSLRDENQALRLQASQSCQNQYLINALRPTPVPSFNVGYNPYGYGYGFGYGTTIA